MDTYDLQARHAPFIFALLPVAIVDIGIIPSLGSTKLSAGSIGLLLLVSLGLMATRFARSIGYARQESLYAAWGGKPTTAMLRLRDSRLNPQTKLIYRDRLRQLGDKFPIPSEEEEALDPAGADIKIDAAMAEVRKRVKERGLKAVQRENINYGAARNAFGLKPFGLGACILAIFGLGGTVLIRVKPSLTPADIVVAMSIAVIAAVWVFACTSNRVRPHAEAYALALFEAINIVVPEKRSRSSDATPKASQRKSAKN